MAKALVRAFGILAMAFATAAWAEEPEPTGPPVVPDKVGRPLERVAPVYPPAALRQALTGKVTAWVYVSAEGRVTRVRIRKSSHELFSDAAETALLQWKWQPALKDGKPIASINEYTLDFNLSDTRGATRSKEAPAAETINRYVTSDDGVEVFRTEYWKSAGHKAFASAESGAWSWAGGRASQDQAVQSALESCERKRSRFTSACRIVNIDGEWQAATDRAAARLHDLLPLEMAFYPRETVAQWPDPRRSTAIELLDSCRAAGESFIPVWKSEDKDAIWDAIGKEMRDMMTRTDFDAIVGAMRSMAGVMSQATLKQETFVTRKGDEELRLDVAVVNVYSATTARNPTGLTLLLTMAREGDNCRVTGFQYLFPGMTSPWMNPVPPSRGT